MNVTAESATATIGELCELVNGRAFKPTEWTTTGLPIIRIQNLNDETKEFNYFEGDYNKKHEVNDGDLLFSWSGTPGTSFGAFFWNRGRGVLNQHIFNVLIDKKRVEKRYFRYAINSRLNEIISHAHGGVGLQHITKGKLESVEIPLPQLSEQKRIADILDKAAAIRRKRQKAAVLTRALEESLFADMFMGGKNRSQHKIQVLDELCSIIRDGVHKTPTYVPKGIPFVTVRNLTAEPNRISFADCKFISSEDHTEFSRRTNPELGDILVSKDGTIGVAREITGGLPFNIFVSVALLKPNRDIIHPTFLKTQFNMPFVQRQILDEIKGVAIRHLHLKDFKRLSLVVPDMQTQLDFVAKIERLQSTEDTHISAIREAQCLFNSLAQRAFKGTL